MKPTDSDFKLTVERDSIRQMEIMECIMFVIASVITYLYGMFWVWKALLIIIGGEN
jgi:hypothetical protein